MEQQQIAPKPMDYPISVETEYQEKLSRLTTFFRILTVIPAMVVYYFISLAAGVVVIVALFAILFTGKYPKGLYEFVAGALRWGTRISGYTYLMTDKYPPFSLK